MEAEKAARGGGGQCYMGPPVWGKVTSSDFPLSSAHSYPILFHGKFICRPGNHDSIGLVQPFQCEIILTLELLATGGDYQEE